MSASYSSSRRRSRSRATAHHSSKSAQKTDRSTRSSTRTPSPASPLSFFGKILAFLGLASSEKKSSKKRTSSKTKSIAKERSSRTPRQPEAVEVTSPRLYIGNLSFEATESDLFELFSGVGQVQNVELVSNRDTHRSKGFGFVQMTSLEEAKRAVSELHDKEYMGRKLVVSGAKEIPANRMEPRSEKTESQSESPS